MKVRGDFLGPPRSTDKTTLIIKVSNGAKIRNRYNQVPHLTQDTNGKVRYFSTLSIHGTMEIYMTPILIFLPLFALWF